MFIFELEDFKKKLKTCEDSSDVRIVYAVVVDQVSHMKSAIEELRQKLQEKEARLAAINLEEYKSAMVQRITELTGR